MFAIYEIVVSLFATLESKIKNVYIGWKCVFGLDQSQILRNAMLNMDAIVCFLFVTLENETMQMLLGAHGLFICVLCILIFFPEGSLVL